MQKAPFRFLAFVYLIGIAVFSAFLLPGAVSESAGKAAIIAPLAGIAVSWLYAFVLYRVVAVHGSVRGFIQARFGKKAAKTAGILLGVWLAVICVYYAVAFCDRLASTSFRFLSPWVSMALLFLTASLFARQKTRVLFGGTQVVFGLAMLSFAALLILSAGSFEGRQLLPVKVDSFTALLRSFLFPLGMTGFLSMLLFYESSQTPSLFSLRLTLAAGNAVMLLMFVLIEGVFGLRFAQTLKYPFFCLIKSTDSVLQSEHLESLVSGTWIVISVSFFALLLHLLATVLQNETGDKKGTQFYFFAALLFTAAVLLNEAFSAAQDFLGLWMPLGNLLRGVIGTSILSLTKRRE